MPRPSTHDDALRRRLLRLAAELLAEQGPDRVTLRGLASAAGTSTTAVYSLFGGKPQLLSAVIEEGFRSFGAAQLAAQPAGLRELGRSYRRWALAHVALYRLMFGGTPGTAPGSGFETPESLATIIPLRETLAGTAITRGTSPEVAASVVWGQVHGIVSLEIAGIAPPGTSWDETYEAALGAIARAWAE